MPPKSASTTGAPRGPLRFTARKSISNSTTSINFPIPSPSTAVPTASESSVGTRPLHTFNTEKTLQIRAHATTPASEIQSQSSRETLASNSGLVNSDMGSIGCSNYKESGQSRDLDNLGLEHYGPEKIIHVEAATVVGSGDSKNVAKSSSPPVAGSGNRKRKIVKKMVRIVKKVIKKRVPKRVVKDGSENQGVVVKAEDGANLSEMREKTGGVNDANDILSTVDDLTENLNDVNDKSNHVNDVTEKTSNVDEVIEKENIADEVTQELNLENASNVSAPVIIEKDNYLSAIAYMETEGPKLNFTASFSEQNLPANESSGVNSMEAENTHDFVSVADRNSLTICTPGLMEVQNFNNDPGTIIETKQMDFLVENEKIDTVDKVDVELLAGQNVGEKTVVLDEGENGRTIGKAESGSEVDSDRIRLTEGVLLSGEMEALERKKRRKTEIFIGGLDRNTKEDDIRKAFGEAGIILEIRLVMSRTGKNRGFAFVRFSTAADAKNAVAKYSKVEICGRQCNVAPVEGNDTIFLGNIDRNWKTENVMAFLEKAGIEKIDRATLKADPNDIEKNRGFAFIEFQTCKDAQNAFSKLQKKNVFGKKQMVKVGWAQPLIEPSEEEILQVKSVYAEYLPSSWDEEKVKDYFKRFGEIENVVLAKDLPSSRRKDFAFINYTTREAALTCIEAVNRERSEDDCSKVKIAVSLAKPVPKGKQVNHTSDLTSKQLSKPKENAFQTSKKLHEPRNKEMVASSSYAHVKADNRPSTTDELVQILRQQASNKHILLHPRTGTDIPDHRFSVPGSKRPFSLVGHDPLHVERLDFSRPRMESSYPISGPSSSSLGVGLSSFPYHHRRGPGLPSESANERRIHPSHFQTREQARYYADNDIYRRY